MSNSSPSATSASAPAYDEDAVFEVLRSPTRRNLLYALAKGGPQTGDDLKILGHRGDKEPCPFSVCPPH